MTAEVIDLSYHRLVREYGRSRIGPDGETIFDIGPGARFVIGGNIPCPKTTKKKRKRKAKAGR